MSENETTDKLNGLIERIISATEKTIASTEAQARVASDADTAAQALGALYNALLKQGFDSDQAFEIVRLSLPKPR